MNQRSPVRFNYLEAVFLMLLFAAIGIYINFYGHASSACTVTVASTAAASTAVSSATPGSTVCMTAGSYGVLALAGTHTGDVTIEPDPAHDPNGAGRVTLDSVTVDANASHIVLRNFYIYSSASTPAIWMSTDGNASVSADSITIDHNDIDPYGIGIGGGGWDCNAPHAPGQPCTSTRKMMSNITLSGNRIHYSRPGAACSPVEQDALKIGNFNGVTVTGNEITGVIEPAPVGVTCGANIGHDDCWQSTGGGLNITYDHNYVHDNVCQDFFLKDGDVTNATVFDNLFLRDRAVPSTILPGSINVSDTHNLIIRNNTDWSGAGDGVFYSDPPPTTCTGDARCSTAPYTTAADHNVLGVLSDYCGPPYGKAGSHLTESLNIFGQFAVGSSCYVHSSTDQAIASPAFKNPVNDNYELASLPSEGCASQAPELPNCLGVDWAVGKYAYGPVADIVAPPDVTPPTAPTSIHYLQGYRTSTSVILAWRASTDKSGSGIAGYRVYRNGTYAGTTAATNLTDKGLTPNTSYTYTVKAYDKAGNVSISSQARTITTKQK